MILKHQQKTLNHQALMPIKGPELPCLQVGTVRTKVGQTLWQKGSAVLIKEQQRLAAKPWLQDVMFLPHSPIIS